MKKMSESKAMTKLFYPFCFGGSAIQLEDCQCIGLKISEKVTRETLLSELEDIFTLAGRPALIIKDADATLNKGVRLWSKKQENSVFTIKNISHTMANALKIQHAKTIAYKHFISLTSHGAKCLCQTELAFIPPPKLRSKGRFLSISKLGKWGENELTCAFDAGFFSSSRRRL